MRTTALTLVLAVVALAPASAVAAEPEAQPHPGALLFGKTCSGCHTVGEGDRAGPDLLGVTERRTKEWMATFVRSPGAVIDGGDKVANDLLKKFNGLRMPDQPLTDPQFDQVYEWLAACGKAGGCKIVLSTVKNALEALPEDIALGKDLFEGRVALEKGGAACLACHQAAGAGILGGGTVGSDLTLLYATLGDDAVQKQLATPVSPLMKDGYLDKPLTDKELFAIKAYLASVSTAGAAAREDSNFLYLGVIGFIVVLGGIGLLWNGRMRGVRRDIVRTKQRGHA